MNILEQARAAMRRLAGDEQPSKTAPPVIARDTTGCAGGTVDNNAAKATVALAARQQTTKSPAAVAAPVAVQPVIAPVAAPALAARPTRPCLNHSKPDDWIDQPAAGAPGMLRTVCRRCGKWLGYRPAGCSGEPLPWPGKLPPNEQRLFDAEQEAWQRQMQQLGL